MLRRKLDSTQALIVAARTMDRLGLPRANILAYTMPGFATSELTLGNAHGLMQALGAYGFLGIDRGQPEFLDHIPAALRTLNWIAVERGVLPLLAPVLKPGEKRVA